jgi:DNA helicase HerA-like ATPase
MNAMDGNAPLSIRTGDAAAAACSRLGRVVASNGSQAIIILDASEAGADNPGLQIGALVKIPTSHSQVYALVNGLAIPMPKSLGEAELKMVEIELLGECVLCANGGQGPFQRGVSIAPGLGDSVFAASPEDMVRVYARPGIATVKVGSIHQEPTLPALVSVDDLLGKHFAVLGTTGAGKSCAVALMLRAILSSHPEGHVLLLDLHNEYAPVFGERAEVLTPETLELPYWLLTFEELVEVIVGPRVPEREPDIAILGESVLAAKRMVGEQKDRALTVDTPVPYRMGDLAKIIDEAVGKLERASDSAPYLRLKSRLAKLQNDRRYGFMFPGLSVKDNMGAILSRLFRIPVQGKPVTIVDLSSVPSEILNVVVSVICRMTFDFALWSEGSVPVLLVCEEAHRYVPSDPNQGFEPTKRVLSRIAKEGRKYGVSLGVVSQRPSELSMGILSQCNTIFALRLSSQKDQEFVRGAMAESALGLLDFLPSLRNAEAIAVGEGVAVPVRILFDEVPAENQPNSRTVEFSHAWSGDRSNPSFVADVVERWRRQRR